MSRVLGSVSRMFELHEFIGRYQTHFLYDCSEIFWKFCNFLMPLCVEKG